MTIEEKIKSSFWHYGQETLLIDNFKLTCKGLKSKEKNIVGGDSLLILAPKQ